jgi:hypothetical protein
MSKQNLEIINFFLWLVTVGFALIPLFHTIVYELTGFIVTIFDLCLLPGLLFYKKYSSFYLLNDYIESSDI